MPKNAVKRGRGKLIYRAYLTRNGKRVYAREYGLKAWPIWVKR